MAASLKPAGGWLRVTYLTKSCSVRIGNWTVGCLVARLTDPPSRFPTPGLEVGVPGRPAVRWGSGGDSRPGGSRTCPCPLGQGHRTGGHRNGESLGGVLPTDQPTQLREPLGNEQQTIGFRSPYDKGGTSALRARDFWRGQASPRKTETCPIGKVFGSESRFWNGTAPN